MTSTRAHSILHRSSSFAFSWVAIGQRGSRLAAFGLLLVGPLVCAAAESTSASASRDVTIETRYLNFPVKNGAPQRHVKLLLEGDRDYSFDIELADGEPDWWAFIDVSKSRGRKGTLQVEGLPHNSSALSRIDQSDEIRGAPLYQEALRPQFHFSSRRGWNNDPNGLAFFRGEYHLFYQHNPFGWNWGNMHWGHAVSRDLVHWKELGDVLRPDQFGPMFSGSAVVDWRNSSGLGTPSKPPLVLFYTAAGNPTVQCLASSLDGRSVAKFDHNPIIPQITAGNRDPKVCWFEPTGRWVMTLYVETNKVNTIQFLTSTNLKNWTLTSSIDGFFECPDFFELPVDGDQGNRKWVLTAGSSEYMVGTFDGAKFTPETPKLHGHSGKGFYAAQTYSDIPKRDGRRIQIGWLQAPAPGMSFNQGMSLPLELKLIGTEAGPRLTWTPVKEIDRLRASSVRSRVRTLREGDPNPLAKAKSELAELEAEFEPGEAEVVFNVRGASVSYDGKTQELVVNGQRASAPLFRGRQQLRVYIDRTSIEVFASRGLTYVPMPFIPRSDNLSFAVQTRHGAIAIQSLAVHRLHSAW